MWCELVQPYSVPEKPFANINGNWIEKNYFVKGLQEMMEGFEGLEDMFKNINIAD